ncbi:hypothetical protein D3C87_2001250 [compost metagenome]
MVAKRMHVGMRGDQRRLGKLGDLPETCLVHMRQVDHDLQLVAGTDQVATGIRQARTDIRR